MGSNTIKLHRVFAARPELVYKAFLDPEATVKWCPPNGFTASVEHMDVKVGGTYKMSFTNFSTGNKHSFGGEYVELVENELIRYDEEFDDPNLPGKIEVTITLKKVSCGTDVTIVQAGLPEAIPVEMCYLGWQNSMVQFANLVETEVSDG